jgi:hypothetical protein
MITERDIRVQTYAVARLAKLGSRSEVARALAAVLLRPFPDAMPTVIDEDRLRDRRQRRDEHKPIRPQPLVDYGFAQEFGALWVVQDVLPDFDAELGWKGSTWKEMFNRGKTLWNKIDRFVRDPKGHAAWRTGELHVPEDEFFSIVLSGGRARDVSPLGFPALGTADGRVWIGITEDLTFLNETDPVARVARIQRQSRVEQDSRAKLGALRLNPQRDFDVLVLQAIAQIEYYGLSPAPLYLVQGMVETFWSIKSHAESKYRVQQALGRLKADGLVHEPDPDSRFGHIHDLTQLVNVFIDEGIGSHGGTEQLFSSEAWSVNDVQEHLRYGDIDTISWVVTHTDAVRKHHFKKLLGERVVREASEYDPEKFEAVIAAVEPILEPDAELRLLYATSAAARHSHDHAERLLRETKGAPTTAMQDAWMELASRTLLVPERFFSYLPKLDEEHLLKLVRLASFNLTGNMLKRLVINGAISHPENMPALNRLARVIDDVYPRECIRSRLAEWMEEATGGKQQT